MMVHPPVSNSSLNDDEWEEQYVFVELVGMVDPDKLLICTKDNSAILGVDSEMTVLKLGGHMFAGSYEDAMGSVVFFEEVMDGDALTVKYVCHTTKVLQTSRAFLKPKDTEERAVSSGIKLSSNVDEIMMSDGELLKEVLPKSGMLYTQQAAMPVLCKPKIMPLKSVTLEKLEKMQKDAQETVRRQEQEMRVQEKLLLEQERQDLMHETHDED